MKLVRTRKSLVVIKPMMTRKPIKTWKSIWKPIRTMKSIRTGSQ